MKHRPSDGGDHESDPFVDPLFARFLDTAERLGERIERALKPLGLSRAKLAVLDQLARSGTAVSLRLIAEEQGCVPSNVTTLVTRLESDGLVTRSEDLADRRSVRAQLTPSGIEAARAGARAIGRVQREFSESLRPAERVALARILGTLRATTPAEPADGRAQHPA